MLAAAFLAQVIVAGRNPMVSAFIAVVIALVLAWLLSLIPGGDPQIKQIGRVAIIVILVLYLLSLFLGYF